MKEPNVAGSFYPDDKKELSSTINNFLNKVPEPKKKINPWGIIAPHAGYVYSGPTAAYAYKLLKGSSFDTVVVMAPSHFVPINAAALLVEDSYQTPLGNIEIDQASVQELLMSDSISDIAAAFEREHSLEVQLPFLQTVLKDFKLIPLIIGTALPEVTDSVAGALIKLQQQKNILVVASSDMAHFKPAQTNDQLDRVAMDHIGKNDADGLLADAAAGKCEMCGLAPVSVLLSMAKEKKSKIEILDHSNSGDITGDYEGVVGYMSAAVY